MERATEQMTDLDLKYHIGDCLVCGEDLCTGMEGWVSVEVRPGMKRSVVSVTKYGTRRYENPQDLTKFGIPLGEWKESYGIVCEKCVRQIKETKGWGMK